MNPSAPTPEEFLEMSESQEFGELRSTFRKFAFPISIVFLVWFFFYIITATYATDLVSIRVYGAITVGMVLGLAQFATAGLVTWMYLRFADKKLDPASAGIRAQLEGLPRSSANTLESQEN